MEGKESTCSLEEKERGGARWGVNFERAYALNVLAVGELVRGSALCDEEGDEEEEEDEKRERDSVVAFRAVSENAKCLCYSDTLGSSEDPMAPYSLLCSPPPR